jgi:hypothetical protein
MVDTKMECGIAIGKRKSVLTKEHSWPQRRNWMIGCVPVAANIRGTLMPSHQLWLHGNGGYIFGYMGIMGTIHMDGVTVMTFAMCA